jgi:hypothetical protein
MAITRHPKPLCGLLFALLLLGYVQAQQLTHRKVDFCGASGKCASISELTAVNDNGASAGQYQIHVPNSYDPKQEWFDLNTIGPGFLSYLGYVSSSKGLTRIVGPLSRGYEIHMIGINNHGHALVQQNFRGVHYFIYDLGSGSFTPLSLYGQLTGSGPTQPVNLKYLTGLNDREEVFGVYPTPHGPCAAYGRPALGAPGGTNPPSGSGAFALIGCPPPSRGRPITIRSSNNKGQIAGEAGNHGFLWSAGTMTDLLYPSAANTQAFAINNSGIVVGRYQPAPDPKTGDIFQKGFVYDGRQFRTIDFPDALTVTAWNISNRQIVGSYRDRATGTYHGFQISIAALLEQP